MKAKLALLVELQRLDDVLRDTREATAQLDTLKAENQQSLEVFDAMLAEQGERIEETRAFCREKEVELRSIEDDLRRSRARLPSISSQRELTALNKELEISRRNNQKRTEELLKLMTQLEEAEADHAQKTKERAALAEQMAKVEAELAEHLADKLSAAGAHQQRREAVRAALPRPMVGRYDRVAKARNGQAVSDVSDGTCGACNMAVPPQVFNRLMGLDMMETCHNCQRTLVYFAGLDAEAG